LYQFISFRQRAFAILRNPTMSTSAKASKTKAEQLLSSKGKKQK